MPKPPELLQAVPHHALGMKTPAEVYALAA